MAGELDHDYRLYTTPNAGDDTLYVKFFIDAVQDVKASKDAGRPIYKDAEWIDIRTPGSRDSVIRPCRPEDYERFPKHYEAFKRRIAGDAEPVIGTPLSTWPWHGMTRSRVEELKYFNIRTVEQLAGMPDNQGSKVMGFQTMKQAAQGYLQTVKTTAPLARVHALLEAALAKLTEQGVELARLHAKAHGLPEPAAMDVAAPLREQLEREFAKVVVKTKAVEADRPFEHPELEAGRLEGIARARVDLAREAVEADMGKTRKRKAPPPPARRRPGE